MTGTRDHERWHADPACSNSLKTAPPGRTPFLVTPEYTADARALLGEESALVVGAVRLRRARRGAGQRACTWIPSLHDGGRRPPRVKPPSHGVRQERG